MFLQQQYRFTTNIYTFAHKIGMYNVIEQSQKSYIEYTQSNTDKSIINGTVKMQLKHQKFKKTAKVVLRIKFLALKAYVCVCVCVYHI